MDDAAAMIGMDPLEFRLKNIYQGYFKDPYLKEIAANTNGIEACIQKGREYIHWDEKRCLGAELRDRRYTQGCRYGAV